MLFKAQPVQLYAPQDGESHLRSMFGAPPMLLRMLIGTLLNSPSPRRVRRVQPSPVADEDRISGDDVFQLFAMCTPKVFH